MATIETPQISPVAGTYRGIIEVTLKCRTPNVNIYYTDDGTTPDATDNLYTDGTPIEITSTTTIKAIGILSGWTNSAVASATFTMTDYSQKYAAYIKHPGAGEGFINDLLADVACCDEDDYFFHYGFNYELIGAGETVAITIRGGCPDFTWAVTGSDYSFAHATTSVRTNDLTAIAVPSGDGATITITDSCGSIISKGVNAYVPECALPTLSPSSGAIAGSQAVTMSCATGGSTIYYTLDGSEPNESSTQYTAPIYLPSSPITVKARAYASGYNPSDIRTESYTLTSSYEQFVPGVSGDDGYVQYSGVNPASFNNSADFLILGNTSSPTPGYKHRVFIRFSTSALVQGATINSAFLRLTCYQSEVDNVDLTIYANDEDDPSAPTTKEEVHALTLTTANETWNITTNWVDGTQYDSVDITSIIQEIVDRGSYADHIMIVIDGSATDSDQQFASSIDIGSEDPELHVDWNV